MRTGWEGRREGEGTGNERKTGTVNETDARVENVLGKQRLLRSPWFLSTWLRIRDEINFATGDNMGIFVAWWPPVCTGVSRDPSRGFASKNNAVNSRWFFGATLSANPVDLSWDTYKIRNQVAASCRTASVDNEKRQGRNNKIKSSSSLECCCSADTFDPNRFTRYADIAAQACLAKKSTASGRHVRFPD